MSKLGPKFSAEHMHAKDLVLNHGYTAYAAAKKVGISQYAITNAAWFKALPKIRVGRKYVIVQQDKSCN